MKKLTSGSNTTLAEQPVIEVAERLNLVPVVGTSCSEAGFEHSGFVLTPSVLTVIVPLIMGFRGN